MRAIMSLSDRIVVMANGRKIAEGLPVEVAADPESSRPISAGGIMALLEG